MNDSRLSAFRIMVKSIIVEIESERSKIDFNDYNTLCFARQVVILSKTRYTGKFTAKVLTSSVYKITRSVKQAYQKKLTAMCDLFYSLKNYEFEVNKESSSSSSSYELNVVINRIISN
jgi:hypothetical protein